VEGRFSKVGRVHSGRVHIAFGRPVAPDVLRERTRLAEGGFVVVVVRLDSAGQVVGAVDLVSRGVLDDAACAAVNVETEREARNAVHELSSADRTDARVADVVRVAVRRVLARITGYKPDVEVAVVRVADPASVV
jgi:mRNA degradation ribonuclease J1/J2